MMDRGEAGPPMSSNMSGPVEVQLSNGMVALVDAEDAERVKRYSWSCRSNRGGYVYGASYRSAGGAWCKYQLHRWIIGAKPGEVVDHIDGNPLNNQRANLRITDRLGNSRNRRALRSVSHGFKGIYQIHNGRWAARINAGELKSDGRHRKIHLGYFDTAEEAARAYDEAARKHFGEFAALNFPNAGEVAA